jgi:cobalamin biosynthesis Mg chelatase CobN
MSVQSAYRLRRRVGAEAFRRAWDVALAEGWRRVEETAFERVINGETEVWERDGVQIVRQRPCAPHLMIHMLQRAEKARKSAEAAHAGEAARAQKRLVEIVRNQIRALPQASEAELASPEHQQDLAETAAAQAAAEEAEAAALRELMADDADTRVARQLAALAARFVEPGVEGAGLAGGESLENAPKPSPSSLS